MEKISFTVTLDYKPESGTPHENAVREAVISGLRAQGFGIVGGSAVDKP